MKVSDRIRTIFDIRPDEGRLTWLLFVHAFFYGCTVVFAYTAAISLFLAEFDATYLPIIYVSAAVIMTLTGVAYTRLETWLSTRRMFVITVGFLLVTAVILRLGLAQTQAPWLVFALLIWFRLLFALTGLEYWGLAGYVFTLQQGKRLFGLIGSGEMIALVVGYASVSWLVQWVGTANLLWFAALSLAGSLLIVFLILRARPEIALSTATPASSKQRATAPITAVWQNPYRLLIFSASLLSMMGYFLIDFGFFGQVRQQFTHADELAQFIGVFYTAVYIVGFIVRAFLSRALFSRYGLKVGLMLLPVVISVLITAVFVTGLTANMALLFWLMSAVKLSDDVLQATVTGPASLLLYQPLPPAQRLATQAAAESIAVPIGIGLTGGLLMLFSVWDSFNIVWLAGLIFILGAVWSAVANRTFRAYARTLTEALAQRVLEGQALLLNDASTITIIKQKLDSVHPGEVVYALELLERAEEMAALQTAVISLLAHPEVTVRRDALRRIERLKITVDLTLIQRRLEEEEEVAVRAAVLRTFCRLQGEDGLEHIRPYLHQENAPVMRQAAIIGLLHCGGSQGQQNAHQILLQMSATPTVNERVLAAQIIGASNENSLADLLQTLIQDQNISVQRAALTAAGQLNEARLWPLLIAAAANKSVRGTALSALQSCGESVLPTLQTIADRDPADAVTLAQVATICSSIRSSGIIPLLGNKIDTRQAGTRTKILETLSRNGYQPQDRHTQEMVQQQIRVEISQAAWLLAAVADVEGDETLSLIHGALLTALSQNRARLFHLLAFLYDSVAIRRAFLNLLHPQSERRAYALEVLAITVSQSLKGLIMPMVDELSVAERRQRLEVLFPQASVSASQRLRQIVLEAEAMVPTWTQACALYVMGQLGDGELVDVVQTAVTHRQPLLQETAVWALSQLTQPQNGATHMLLTIEKVIILKSISFFSQIPDEILAEVSSYLEEMDVKAQGTLFEKGDYGDSMYIIVSGEMRVHDGDHTLNHLHERDIFGEMAILDPAPRVASVTAVQDTHLLRLDQEILQELMREWVEVSQGIIQVLSQHLRGRVEDLRTLRSQLGDVAAD